jgi:hypothetical protein
LQLRLPHFVASAIATLLASSAHANCNTVIDALEKAMKQERLAQCSLDSRDQPLPSNPMLVRVGKSEYTAYEVGGRFSHFERHETSGGNPILSALKRATKDGSARCESRGADSYRGTAAIKFRIDNPAAPRSLNPMTLWIAKETGLPLYHEVNGLDGGFAWMFGDAVKEPAAKK